jgi:hypothetical protein
MIRDDIGAVLDRIELNGLVAWVRETFHLVDFDLLHCELMLEFDAAAESFLPPPRLVVDLQTNVVTLDGVAYKVEAEGAILVQAVVEANKAGELPAAIRRIRRRIPGCHHDTTFQRRKDRLPKPIQNCIKGKSGAGVYLELPPIK